MSNSFSISARAKVNLLLKVLRKRPDGFHEIETLFGRISLKDDLVFKKTAGKISLRTSSREIPKDSKNLVVRAALLLKERYGVEAGVALTLKKRIPVGAGLGGGSSDAAATLIGLNKLWKLGLSQKKLLDLGAELGSDVPFFILNSRFALAKGRGEKLKKIPFRGSLPWVLLVKPHFGISTQQAYQSLKPPFLTPPRADVRMLVRCLKKRNFLGLKDCVFNSLEAVENKELIEIFKIKKELLENGAFSSLMSGSGSTVFGLFLSRSTAEKAARKFQKNKSLTVFVCKLE